jgi:hypothetical protein
MLLCDGNNGYLMDIEGVFHDFHGLMICGKKKNTDHVVFLVSKL